VTDEQISLNSAFYLGVEPAGNPGEGTTISVTEYTLEPCLTYKVRYLQRFPAGAPYPMIIEAINQIREELRGGLVVLNSTFIGDPIRDMFKLSGITPVSIYVANVKAAIKPHIENAVDPLRKYDHLFWEVPYLDIVSVLQVAFQQGQLQIAPEMELAQSLIDEILTFRVETSVSGKIEKLRIDQNADLLLSVAISVYTAARFGGNRVPIESMTSESTGVPENIDEGHKMPEIWSQEQQNTQRKRINYAWAQPQRQTPSGGSNLPGLM
jgi:hypothetical protein